jgi:hypothetical protein
MYKPVAADLYRYVEPEAGEVLPVTRWRHEEEFCPDWAYICSPAASCEAVVAALYCSMYVHEQHWAAALATHAPQAMALLSARGLSLRQYCQGQCPPDLGQQVDWAINEALGGFEVVSFYPAPAPAPVAVAVAVPVPVAVPARLAG